MNASAEAHVLDIRRDGFAVLRGFLDAGRTARLRDVADGLRTRYLRADPVTGRPGFLVSPWHVRRIDNPRFYEQAPGWWLSEVLELVTDPDLLELVRTLTEQEAVAVSPSLFLDPALPYSVDALTQRFAAPDGAGPWHRDLVEGADDEDERCQLLGTARTPIHGYLLELALVPCDAFEYVPGSHRRWDTAVELSVRRRADTPAERTRPLPGGQRIGLAPGDLAVADSRGIHRGWYAHGVPRRTISLWYYSEFDERLPCLLTPAHLEGLRPATKAFLERWLELGRTAGEGAPRPRATPT